LLVPLREIRKNPPFCDGSHLKAGFEGKETASKAPYADRAQTKEGPGLDLRTTAGAPFPVLA
jgi:hypothetical protein